jgi:hypothetical protein
MTRSYQRASKQTQPTEREVLTVPLCHRDEHFVGVAIRPA